LPTWISQDAKRAIFRSITNARRTNILQWNEPVIVATQLTMTIPDLHDQHTVFLRAMPRFQGIAAQDSVKVLIEEEGEGNRTTTNVYFGKCMAFLMDSDGKQFVVLQWFTRHEANGFDKISNVPSFKLAPEAHTNSYSTLPVNVIVNGALMLPGGDRYWALLSPREHKMYTMCF